jgi:hypothetical protein
VAHAGYYSGGKGRRIKVQVWPGQKTQDFVGKKKKTKTKSKRAGDFTQVVEHLPSKHKALSSSPSTTKEKEP